MFSDKVSSSADLLVEIAEKWITDFAKTVDNHEVFLFEIQWSQYGIVSLGLNTVRASPEDRRSQDPEVGGLGGTRYDAFDFQLHDIDVFSWADENSIDYTVFGSVITRLESAIARLACTDDFLAWLSVWDAAVEDKQAIRRITSWPKGRFDVVFPNWLLVEKHISRITGLPDNDRCLAICDELVAGEKETETELGYLLRSLNRTPYSSLFRHIEHIRPTVEVLNALESVLKQELPQLADRRIKRPKWRSHSELAVGMLALAAREMTSNEIDRNPESELIPVVRERFRALAQHLFNQTNGCNYEIESLLGIIQASHDYECAEPQHDEQGFLINHADFGITNLAGE